MKKFHLLRQLSFTSLPRRAWSMNGIATNRKANSKRENAAETARENNQRSNPAGPAVNPPMRTSGKKPFRHNVHEPQNYSWGSCRPVRHCEIICHSSLPRLVCRVQFCLEFHKKFVRVSIEKGKNRIIIRFRNGLELAQRCDAVCHLTAR